MRYCIFSVAVALLLVAATAVSAAPPSPPYLEGYTFESYVRDFSKHYDADEYPRRKELFEKRLAGIMQHNRDGHHLYVRGVNHMSDWSPQEFRSVNGAKPRMTRHAVNKRLERSYPIFSRKPPFEVDYRTRVPAILTAVKNQGHCGSCWAHSAAQAMESHWALATGRLHVLSQQQITSCTPNPRHCGGTGGCFGSIEALAFEYVHDAGGISEEWSHPYTSYFGTTGACANFTKPVAKVHHYVRLPKNNQMALMDALAFRGPIAVSVDASDWSDYAGGIFDGCHYSQNITQNHAVQLVGYGHDKVLDKDYWVIRNSWGPQWGENGYIRLLRTTTPQCGWSVDTHNGSACDGDSDIAWVCGMCGVLSDSSFPVMDTD